MKKCPYCAEDILDEAIKCKHCGSVIHQKEISKQPPAFVGEKDKKSLKWLGKALLVVFAILVWYISIPLILIWYIWKKTKLDKKKKIIATFLIFAVFVIIEIIFYQFNKTPVITILEPQNNSSVQTSTIKVSGKISPSKSEITINNLPVDIKDGEFTYDWSLKNEKNKLILVATNDKKEQRVELEINRVFSSEEKAILEAERQAQKQQQLEDQKNKLKNEISELNNFDGSIYKKDITTILAEVGFFSAYKSLINNAKSSEDVEIKKLGQQLENKIIQLQIKEFPLLRKEYGKLSSQKLWEHNGTVSVYGASNKTIELTASIFANNKNIADMQGNIQEVLKTLRFTKVIYKWYKYDKEYSYYELDSLKDNEL